MGVIHTNGFLRISDHLQLEIIENDKILVRSEVKLFMQLCFG